MTDDIDATLRWLEGLVAAATDEEAVEPHDRTEDCPRCLLDTYSPALARALVSCGKALVEIASEDWWCEECSLWVVVDDYHTGDDLPICPTCSMELTDDAGLRRRAEIAAAALRDIAALRGGEG